MKGRILVIECATPALSCALLDDGAILAADHREIGRGHAEALLPAIAALPDAGRCDAILVDVGPGSFTGVRVGLAAARALGFAWRVPVRGYRCLDLVAAMVRAQHAPQAAFLVAMVGGHGELFWQRFAPHRPGEREPGEPASAPIDALAATVRDATLYGSGAAQLVAVRGQGVAVAILPDARATTLLAPGQWLDEADARYGRGADAKPMAVPASRGPA